MFPLAGSEWMHFMANNRGFEIESTEMGYIYVADIPANTRVWLSPPKVGIPEQKGTRGRVPTKVRVLEGEPRPIEVRKLKDQLEESQ